MKKTIAAAVLAAVMLTGCSANAESDTVSAEDDAIPAVNTNASALSSEETQSEDSAAYTEAVTEAQSETETTSDTQTETAAEAVEFSCADITAKILEEVSMSSMAQVGSDRIGYYLDIDAPADEDFSMYICGSGGFADEIAVFFLENIDESALEDALESRVETRMKDFEDYNPDESKKLEDAVIKESNGYLLFSVTADNDKAVEIFESFVNAN